MTETTPVPAASAHECKFALYFEAQDGSRNDLLLIKEYEHTPDGRQIPHLRKKYNYKRPFWVTRESFRKHKDKKEWELIDRLQRYESTQIDLVPNIARALGRAPTQTTLRMMSRSPYLYGCDVTTPVLIKRAYMDKWPNAISDNRVAMLDSETDMLKSPGQPGYQEIIMLSITMKDKAKIVIVNDYIDTVYDAEAQIHRAMVKYLGDPESSLGDLITKRGINLEVEFAKNAGECVHRILKTAHEWKPDIVGIWNMNYDLPKMISALQTYGYDLAQEFSDPSIPEPFKFFKYIEGNAQKVTASGKTMALHPAEQWHVVQCPASFYFLDAMCVYLKLRIAKGKEQSYALDAILQKHLGIRKLKFSEADHVGGGKWHMFMQQNYKVEYCIYNLFDCISLEMLDDKTTDLKRMVTTMCGHSEFHRFPSQPRRTCDDLHFFALQNGKVAATTSDKMIDELDELVVDLTDWIVTLPSYMVADEGLRAVEELPGVGTTVFAHVADLDVEGTYPNEEIILNISKETTAAELSKIQGISTPVQRAIGINLSGGNVNAVEICMQAFNAPSFDELLVHFQRTINQPSVV